MDDVPAVSGVTGPAGADPWSLPSFDPGFSSALMQQVLGPDRLVARMCAFEGALALASADHGVIPADAASRIAGVSADHGAIDARVLLRTTWDRGTPIPDLLQALRARLDEDAGGWLHHGATTQDAIDTALVLLARDALGGLVREISVLADQLADRAVAQRDEASPAWTFLQPAVPTTVGARVAGWAAPLPTHMRDVMALLDRLPVQLGGPTGTLADFGPQGLAVMASMAERLELADPGRPWHTDRTIIRTLAGVLERIAATMATIATDLSLLASTGHAAMRAGGSSSMPGKRNPIDAIRAVAAAEVCAGVASTLTRGRPGELERGIGGWHAEWFALPMALHTCGAAVDAVRMAVSSLTLVGGDPPPAEGPTPTTAALVDRVAADVAAARQELVDATSRPAT